VIGKRLGSYEILAPLGESDPASVERLQREARAIAALNHPNIWQIRDRRRVFLGRSVRRRPVSRRALRSRRFKRVQFGNVRYIVLQGDSA
jgi:hypothetical protein